MIEFISNPEIQVIEGEKGCFPPGSLVKTPNGLTPIEDCKVGDLITTYDEDGKIVLGKVIETHKHDTKQTNDKFVIVTHELGTFVSTENHWVLTNKSCYVEAGQLTKHHTIYTGAGTPVKVIKVEPYQDYDYSYNLTTSPHSCFIANNIRVHNKGGGKGGQARTPVEAPDTLTSRQTIRLLEVVSEGVIEEIEQFYLDDNPYTNFPRTTVDYRQGLPSQSVISGFSDVEVEFSADTPITFNTPFTREVSAVGVDAVRLTVGIDSLFTQNTTNGDLTGNKATIAVYIAPPDVGPIQQPFVFVREYTFDGKTMTPFFVGLRIDVPSNYKTGLWKFRIFRTTPDGTSATVGNATRILSYTEIVDKTFTYPNTAVVGWKIDAEATNGRVPRRSYDVKGIRVRVPSNYNEETRVYTGIWNGTFKTNRVYTNNPIWIIYELLTNTRFGIGLPDQEIDKFSFYDAALYCDAQVDDGGGVFTEPRFTFNAQIFQREDAFKVIQSIASTARAFISYVGGVVECIQDRPRPIEDLVTNSDVIGGNFEYTSSALQARYNVVNVTYNDPNNRFLADIVTEKDTTSIAKYGENPTDIIAFGCTSEGQARRLAKWKLETDNTNIDVVTFKVGLNRLRFKPGRVINLWDENYTTIKGQGKIVSANTTTIVLDDSLVLPNETIKIQYYSTDGQTLNIVTVNQSNVTTNTFTGTFANTGLANSTAIIHGVVEPRPFSIETIAWNPEDQTFDVIAIFYDADKYARIEQGIVVPPRVFSDPGLYTQQPPANLQFIEEQYDDGQGSVRKRLRVSWTAPLDNENVTYMLMYRRDSTEWTTIRDITARQYTIQNALPGVFEVYVYAFNVRSVRSTPLVGFYTLDTTTASALLPPINLRVQEL